MAGRLKKILRVFPKRMHGKLHKALLPSRKKQLGGNMTCSGCGRMGGIALIVFGIIYLLVDLGVWNFWGISWWTMAFLLIGIGSIGCASCADCQCCVPEKRGNDDVSGSRRPKVSSEAPAKKR